eukprot:TRINITY_DN67159_c6_g1_i1.p1 TRINITY_DN67159_c6_g1~~TRINITY_DN67159_c6_g1_i1.p1  ORF type:complete len:422 (+),score=53.64 TRINITY_DN67159_c6_g1_i1:41-1306(+)
MRLMKTNKYSDIELPGTTYVPPNLETDPRTGLSLIRPMLKHCSELDDSIVHWCSKVVKTNRHGNNDNRILIVSDEALYLAHNNSYLSISRCIRVNDIAAIVVQPVGDCTAWFNFTVPSQYDMRLKITDFANLVPVLQTLHTYITRSPLNISHSSTFDVKKLRLQKPKGFQLDILHLKTKQALARALQLKVEMQKQQQQMQGTSPTKGTPKAGEHSKLKLDGLPQSVDGFDFDPRLNLNFVKPSVVEQHKPHQKKYEILDSCCVYWFGFLAKRRKLGSDKKQVLIVSDDTLYTMSHPSLNITRCIPVVQIEDIVQQKNTCTISIQVAKQQEVRGTLVGSLEELHHVLKVVKACNQPTAAPLPLTTVDVLPTCSKPEESNERGSMTALKTKKAVLFSLQQMAKLLAEQEGESQKQLLKTLPAI